MTQASRLKLKVKARLKMTETKVSKKSKSDKDAKEIETKTKPKKTKVKDEPLEPKVSQPNVAEPLDDAKVDVEIDLRSYNHSDAVDCYIRRKRLI